LRFDVVTIFPEFFRGPFEFGVVGQAVKAGLLEIEVHDLRKWTYDKHRTVDDRPFGGGEGMLLKPEPMFQAVEEILPERTDRTKVVLVSANGRRYDQSVAREWSKAADRLLVLCGRYEGVDARVSEHLVDDEVSIGDYVLSGGELAAAVIVDSVARLLPGVVGNQDSTINESYSVLQVEDRVWKKGRDARGKRFKGSHELQLLDCPQYTRPAEFRGWKVPAVLLGGNHEEIRKWRLETAIRKTAQSRPDLLPADLREEFERLKEQSHDERAPAEGLRREQAADSGDPDRRHDSGPGEN
jgi:tRNA (guanine37-N1)-methyltransferase